MTFSTAERATDDALATRGFSVVIPFRDAMATLDATLATVAMQTWPHWEALLVNDGSHDNSLALAEQWAVRDTRFRLIAAPLKPAGPVPRGVAATRNLGIAAAKGAFVAFLDADDLWRPEKLALQAAAFERGADIVFSAYRRIGDTGTPMAVVPARHQINWADALCGNPIGCLTAAYRQARFPGARMPLIPMHEDYAFWLGLLREGAVAHGVPDVLADYRVRSGSVSARKLRAARAVWQILGREPISPARRLRGFACYALLALRRRL